VKMELRKLWKLGGLDQSLNETKEKEKEKENTNTRLLKC